MEVEIDETVCGPLCQHPSCWESHKRLYKGRPRRAPKMRSPSPPEEQSLPTQNIVNLLDAYGDDHYDYCPPKRVNQRAVSNSSSATALYSNRPPSRESYPKMKTPMVTPASLLQSSSVNIGETTPQQSEEPVMTINKVEVQEVFDLDDLRSDWHDTFVARQYYVWVPNPNANKEKTTQTKSIIHDGEATDSRASVLPKDLTETMVPRHVSWERNTNKMRRNIGSPKTPQQGLHLPNRSGYSSRTPREYYGIYELLDLPRDVLNEVLQLIDRRDLVDREHLIDALIKAFPQLEHQNSSLSMAYGDVLQQTKLQLHSEKCSRPRLDRIHFDTLPTKQIYVMDVGSHGQSQYVHIPSQLLTRPVSQLSTRRLSPLKPDQEATARHLPQKHPLPSISVNGASQIEKKSPRSIRMSSVSLGLPQLPSGVKITRPFAYNQKDLDLTLGPVTQPSPFEPVPQTRKPSASPRQDQPQSPAVSERASSIVVTMPSVPTEHTDPGPGSVLPMKKEVTDGTEKNQPLHAVSPSYSTNVPNAPAGTPAMRQSASFVKDLPGSSPSPTKLRLDAYGSPIDGALPISGSVIIKPIGTPEMQVGVLDTIRESEPDEHVPQPADYRLRSELPKSRRNVRFLTEVPRQPPSTPNSSGQDELTATQLRQYRQEIDQEPTGADSVSNNPSDTSPDPLNDHQMAPPASTSLPPSRDTRTSTAGEPWPLVDERAYLSRSPTPLTQLPARSASCTPAEPDQSMAGQYDARSEQSVDTTPLSSREPSYHSAKKASLLRERVAESPGPPPPSPEPKPVGADAYPDEMGGRGDDDDENDVRPSGDRDPAEAGQSAAAGTTPPTGRFGAEEVDDVLADTESELTITAKPPSNLDELSTIPTPATLQRLDTAGNGAIAQSRDAVLEVSAPTEGSAFDRLVVDGGDDAEFGTPPPDRDPREDDDTQRSHDDENHNDVDGDDDDDDDDGGGGGGGCDEDMEQSSTKPQQPAYADPVTSDPASDGPLLRRTVDTDDKLLHLDHFEADDNTFKEELEHELSRLSQEQDQQKTTVDENPVNN